MDGKTLLRFRVFGDPMVTSAEFAVHDRGKRGRKPLDVESWRKSVRHAAIKAGVVPQAPFRCPLGLALSFTFRRPPSHYISGRQGERRLQPGAPMWHTAPGRFCADALATTAVDALAEFGFWTDRSQVCLLTTGKQYGVIPGITIALHDVSQGGFPPTFERVQGGPTEKRTDEADILLQM